MNYKNKIKIDLIKFLVLLSICTTSHANPLKESIDQQTLPEKNIVGWGDSMIAPKSGFFDNLMHQPAMIQRLGINQGIGGQNAEQISERAGGKYIQINIIENNLEEKGTLEITNYNGLKNTNFSLKAKINGIPGIIKNTFTGNINKTTFTTNPTKEKITPPYQAIPVSTFFYSKDNSTSLEEIQNFIYCIRLGRNDVGKQNFSADQIIKNIKSITSKSKNKYIVIGVTSAWGDLPKDNGGNQINTKSFITTENDIIKLNSMLLENFGNQYIDIQSEMIKLGFGDATTIENKQYLLLNKKWSFDGTHESEEGKEATAKIVARKILDLDKY